jgi:polysaccharide biosynthesis/export protein
MKSRILLAMFLLGVMGVAALADESKPATPKQPSATASPAQPSEAAVDTYIIGPQDVLQITVWKEPDLSGAVPVRPDGKISLALLNDVDAAGLTPTQLAQSLATRMKKYVAEPQVTVIVTQINSRRVYVLGQVMRPGAMPLTPDMTIIQAITTAGGLTQFADGKKSYVLRFDKGVQIRIPVNYKLLVKGEKMDANILLKAGDTIVVP